MDLKMRKIPQMSGFHRTTHDFFGFVIVFSQNLTELLILAYKYRFFVVVRHIVEIGSSQRTVVVFLKVFSLYQLVDNRVETVDERCRNTICKSSLSRLLVSLGIGHQMRITKKNI